MENNKLISVEDNNLKIKWRDAVPQIVASCSINCLVIQAGINMAFSSILIPQLSLPDSDILVDVNSASTIASIVTISIAIGSFFCGPLMDKLGRQRLSIYICLPFIIAWLLLTLSQNVWMIYVARLLSGIAGGMTTVALVYVGEISHPNYRGMLLCLNSVFVSLGILITYTANIFFQWRTVGAIFTVLSIATMLVMLLLPESPSWLISLNRKNNYHKSDALLSMNWLYRNQQISSFYYHQLIDNDKLRQDKQQIKNGTTTTKRPISYFLSQPQVYKPLMLLFFLFLFQQLSGAYVLIFYTINIFRNLSDKFSENVNENLALILLGMLRLICSVIAAGISRQCRRKVLLCTSAFGMSVFSLIAAMLITRSDELNDAKHFLFPQSITTNDTLIDITSNDSTSFNEVLLLVSILGYVCFGALGVLIIPWTLISELFPIEVKGTLGGIIVTIAYTLMFGVVKIFPYLLNHLTMQGVLFLFSLNSFLCCIYVFIFMPETYGKSFNEIEKYFQKLK
ncbi:unnamed protein product [Diamesa hyperborea]